MTTFMLQVKEPDFNKKGNANGSYVCSACYYELFTSSQKFEAGCGFPSFSSHVGDHVRLNPLDTYRRKRIQLLCNNCSQHLGHLFDNKHTATKVL